MLTLHVRLHVHAAAIGGTDLALNDSGAYSASRAAAKAAYSVTLNDSSSAAADKRLGEATRAMQASTVVTGSKHSTTCSGTRRNTSGTPAN